MNKAKSPEKEYEEKLAKNLQVINQEFDAEFTCQVAKHLTGLLEEVYFRPLFIGFDDPIERNNTNHPVLLVSNHSGMSFPWDAMVFGSGLLRKMNFDHKKSFRAMVAPMLSQTNLMNPYLIDGLWYRIGGVDATFKNMESMMQNAESNLLIYPEGVPGIGKGWNRKYQLQRFATSFVRMSLKYRTDVVPFYSVNGENINPYSYSFKPVNKLVRKIGIPFLPVGLLILLLPFQPWLFYYAWPAKLVYVKGKRLSPYEWIEKPFQEITEDDIRAVRNRIQSKMQKELNEAVTNYGHSPYMWKEHFYQIRKNLKYFPYFLPWGWVFLFHEFMRKWHLRKPGEEISIDLGWGSFIRILFKNPFTIFYFIPILGWIPILIKGYKGGIKKGSKFE